MSGVSIKEIKFGKYGNCVELCNGEIDVVVTVECGPRIIRLGFVGEENEFFEDSQFELDKKNDEYRFMGGHRLWHSPESMPRTYAMDNEPVEWSIIDNGIKVESKVEPWAQIKKEMEITLEPLKNSVKVIHRLTNKNAWNVEFAAWSVTQVSKGGMEVVPQPQRETGFLNNRVLSLWSYANMADARVYWGKKYITLCTDEKLDIPFKFGINNEKGFACYFNHGNLLVKKYSHDLNAKYPDSGVSYESFTRGPVLEMETLSPLELVEPEKTITHIDEFDLFKDILKPSQDNEEEIHAIIKKYVKL